MATNPGDVFSSSDRFERLTRAEIADFFNEGLELHDDDMRLFSVDDDRLSDEVCYAFVEWYSNCGDPMQCIIEVLEEYPELRD